MGTESENKYTLYKDGVPITPGKLLQEITLSAEAIEPENKLALECECMEFTMHIKTPKRWRCRGRKRFVKLMMSEGITRNYAERLADFTRTMMPYGEAWRNLLWHKWG